MPDADRSRPRLPPAQARQIRPRLQRLIRDASQTDLGPDADPNTPSVFWELDPSALVIEAHEWAELSVGLIQRARLVNAFLRDIYHEQQVLRERVLPPEIVLADPFYRRPCRGLEPERLAPATLLRLQLLRTGRGWIATSVSTNTPIGLSYAVQNRRFLSQEAGELYADLPDYHAIVNTPLQLLESLRALSPNKNGDPSIVVLTAGPHDPFYSEHSFLARKMGLPLARGDDLLVLDNRVYFKTIAGLEVVDIIYRRLNDAHIDPVVFSTPREGVGVPGLLHCVRQGTVVVANAIGSGVAESRALDQYWPQLSRYYLGEELRLPGLPTLRGDDPEALEAFLAYPGSHYVRAVHDLPGQEVAAVRVSDTNWSPPRGGDHRFVVQNLQAMVDEEEPAPLLSVFVLAKGDQFEVVPGGLARFDYDVNAQTRVGCTADLVVLQDSGAPATPPLEISPHRVNPRVLGSRAAEHLYWLGRYLERAEATARMVSIFNDVTLEEIPRRERRKWRPVWQGLLEATGQGSLGDSRTTPMHDGTAELLWRLTLEVGHPSSIASSIDAATENGRQLRDCLSPEVWVVLSRLRDKLHELHRAWNRGREVTRDDLAQQAVQRVLIDVNAWWGTGERTLVQDSTWHFLRVGAHLERAIMTCSALRHILSALDAEAASSPGLLEHDNPELSALVRMLGSQDAYRRLYQAPSVPQLVTDLFLEQPSAPRSLRHNLQEILRSLENVRADVGPNEGGDEVRARVAATLESMQSLKFSPGESGAHAFGERWANLLTRLFLLHTHLSDHYFSHQARLPRSLQLSML